MTEVLPDQLIDRAEAFRLAKSYRLPPEVALNRDPDVLRFDLFTACYGISDSGIIRRIRSAKLSAGMMSAISSAPLISYADRLSHFTDRDSPVSFVDLRCALSGPALGGSPPSSRFDSVGRGLPDYPPVAPAEPETGAKAVAAERQVVRARGQTDDARWGVPRAPRRAAALTRSRKGPGPNPFQILSGPEGRTRIQVIT